MWTNIVKNPEITLPALVRRQLDQLGKVEPAGWFAQRLESGDCVIVLDGLDEVNSRRCDSIGLVEAVQRNSDLDHVIDLARKLVGQTVLVRELDLAVDIRRRSRARPTEKLILATS